MSRFGFVGPSYPSQSPVADAERCINWYPELIESGDGKGAYALYPTPGLKLFCTFPDVPLRALYAFNSRAFAVSDDSFYEIFPDGTFTKRGVVSNDGNPAQMAANATQILIAAGGGAYVFTLATNEFHTLDVSSGNVLEGRVTMCGGADGYLIALLKESQKIQISALEDATTWSTLGVPNVDQVSVFPENLLSMIVDHRELWLFGSKATVVYYNSGSANIFDPVPGGYIEQGIGAAFSAVRLDNSVFWIGGDERGTGVAWRAQGYSPVRVSNHAVENEWRLYPTIADAVAYPYQDCGHSFWVIRFPAANKTWVYDAATGMWHERSTWNAKRGIAEAHPGACHAFVFGKHLVGDPSNGNVYQMAVPYTDGTGAWQFVTDNGAPITRIRRSPYISTEQTWIRFNRLQVDIEAGTPAIPPLTDGTGKQRDPQLLLRWSDDNGHSWSNSLTVGYGEIGKYRARAIWRRLGRSRGRIFEVSAVDPVPARIIDAYLDATPGFGPQERLATQYKKVQ